MKLKFRLNSTLARRFLKAGNLSSSCKKWKVKLFCDKIVRKKSENRAERGAGSIVGQRDTLFYWIQ